MTILPGFLRLATVAALAATLAACGPSDADLRRAVTDYDARLVEAYRTSDVRAVEAVAGEAEARKLAGLIGVKRDMGVTLDAELLELRFVGIAREGDEFVVSTEERWWYQDRRIGSGERVGQDSTDRYAVRYRLRRRGRALVVEAVEFAAPPQVGRTEVPAAGLDALHGIETRAPAPAAGAPAAGDRR